MKSPRVSAIIVTWNVAQEALACIEALYASGDGIELDVTVVDNASSDGTVDLVQRRYPGLKVIGNHDNLGFACACNQGVRQSEGECVLFVNPDCLVTAGCCALLASYLTNHPDVGAVGPRLLRPDGRDDWCSPRQLPTLWSDLCDHSGLANLLPQSPVFAAHRLPLLDRHASSDVIALSGACFMVRRDALVGIGLLDERFFMFGEDVDLCLRLRQAGWKLHFLGEARAVHGGGASTKQVADEMVLHAVASRHHFFHKHRGRLYATLYRVAHTVLAGAKLAFLVPATTTGDRRRRARLQWRLLRFCMQGCRQDLLALTPHAGR